MIREMLTWGLTSCPAYVRRMGYLYQAIALMGRYNRRRESWQPHLEKTKAIIVDAIQQCTRRRKAIILGSGLLLDVPIDNLSDGFDEVVLVDVVHLPEVKWRIRKYSNVRLVQFDITVVAEKLFDNIKQRIYDLPVSIPHIPEVYDEADLVVSLNIISQLAAIPLDYLSKKSKAHSESETDVWCDQIRQAHYEELKRLPCNICLIADHEFIRRDREGNVVEQGSTVGSLALKGPDKLWTWHIAPYGEERRKCSKELIVGAWHINNQ